MPATAFRRLWAGDGARRLVCPLAKPERGDWLLARRSVADPTETASFVCFGPATTSLTELVRGGDAVDERSLFRGGQGEVGLDPDEVRRWDGGYWHLTRCLVVHAFLMAMREHAGASHGTPRRMPLRLAAACPLRGAAQARVRLSMAKVKRLVCGLTWPVVASRVRARLVALVARPPTVGEAQPRPAPCLSTSQPPTVVLADAAPVTQ